jgi:hypothetical protein
MDNDHPLAKAAGTAFAFHYHRDVMNAATHLARPQFSPITFELAEALAGVGVVTPAIQEVSAHDGKYPQDRGREMIR